MTKEQIRISLAMHMLDGKSYIKSCREEGLSMVEAEKHYKFVVKKLTKICNEQDPYGVMTKIDIYKTLTAIIRDQDTKVSDRIFASMVLLDGYEGGE